MCEAELEALRAELTKQRQDDLKDMRKAQIEVERALREEYERKIGYEQLQRVAAQRGLVPYVRSLEAFDKWLRKRPALRRRLQPILTELGLWEIKLGYDPDKEVALSVVSPKRR